MENQKQETALKLSKSQVQNIINTHIQEEHGLNDLFAMIGVSTFIRTKKLSP